ncbi:MAG: selenocysteine-specific translation elongation factor [Deltaproteobacteria bacterium]|nr:selenocysteine-specific translation elongation factor [Deltaproteobacteria bacterium]
MNRAHAVAARGFSGCVKPAILVASPNRNTLRDRGMKDSTHLILGTAGHVDHGKTALIKALTQVDTDRLKEEKERGITIELGFAPLILDSGRRMGVVDVPGHERFVKNMVAGAGGIDLVVMVIAADEGIMPQTREHLDICTLLGIRHGLVALTKIDLVDGEWLDLVTDEIHSFLAGSFLEHSPIIPVSSVTGEGMEDLRTALDAVAGSVEGRTGLGFFRIPVDRVFTMKGFGTVITGSLQSGNVKSGDTVQIMPGGATAKIRGIQVHNEPVREASAGTRTAINLQGVSRSAVKRGDVLTHAGIFEPTRRIDISLSHLPHCRKNLKNRAIVRFHLGTAEVLSRIILLGRDEMEPGTRGVAQLVLESPVIAAAGDRFVLRSYSPITTIGGGGILDPLPRKHRRQAQNILEEMNILDGGEGAERARIILRRADTTGISPTTLSIRTGIPERELDTLLDRMLSNREALIIDREERTMLSYPLYEQIQGGILEETKAFHKKFPLREWIHRDELRISLGTFVSPKLFIMALKDLERAGALATEKENLRSAGHRVNLQGELEELKERISAVYRDAGCTPPLTKDVFELFPDKRGDVKKVLTLLITEGSLITVTEDLYFDRGELETLRERYRRYLLEAGQASPAAFRELTGLSRKFTIPLMEYFDKIKLTIRVGDHRVLREDRRQ